MHAFVKIVRILLSSDRFICMEAKHSLRV